MEFSLRIQEALAGDWVVSAGYSGSRGLHLFRIGDANLAPFTVVNGIKVYQTQLGRMNPNFASITQRITDAQSYYNALQLTAQKQFSHGLRAQISYTFSRSIDDASGINSQDYTDGTPSVLNFYAPKPNPGLPPFCAHTL